MLTEPKEVGTTKSNQRKKTIAIDMDNLAKVKKILGTKGTTKTVNAALQRVVDGNRRVQLLRDFLDGNRTDLNDPEVMSRAWYRPPEPE